MKTFLVVATHNDALFWFETSTRLHETQDELDEAIFKATIRRAKPTIGETIGVEYYKAIIS
jgi:hypothetical protein